MEIRTDIPPQEWDRFVAAHPQAHILQTALWGDLKGAFGWHTERVALVADGQVQAAALMLCRRFPGGLGRLAYVPRGPLVDWGDQAQTEALLEALQALARARGALALTVEPDLPDEPPWRERLTALGLQPAPLGSIQPRRTLVVDLGQSEEAILAAMKPKTRYNIRLAARKGVTVREGRPSDLEGFHRLMAVTAARNRFGIHAPAYYDRAFGLFVPRGWARLFIAEVGQEPVAAALVFALPPRAWYFYGASSDAHREKMPTYLLHWEAMRWARSVGCTRYDLWGVPDEEEERLEADFISRQNGLWGVYRFKRGFGGRLTRSVGAWDRPLYPLLYRFYALAVRWRGVGWP